MDQSAVHAVRPRARSTTPAEASLIGTGLYPLSLAARLAGVEARSARRWLLGYARSNGGEKVRSGPLWTTQFAGQELPGEVIGFRDLLELRMVAAFVKHGVDLRVIRATADAARDEYGADYPLTMRRFLTDGKRIFLDAVARTGEACMIDLARRQHVFSEIIRPSLYAGIEYDGDNGAARWFPLGDAKRAVVLDPALQFGKPVLSEVGIPTDTVYASYLAEGEDRATVCRIFDITPKMLDAAVRFEEKLVA